MKNTKTILLVEDDADDQEFFTEALKKVEPESILEIADNGIDALYKLRHSSVLPDYIFMDVNMPHMDGIECLTEVMNDARMKDVPVIMLTSSVKDVDTVAKLGARAFVEKSGDNKKLRRLITELLRPDFSFNGKMVHHTM